MLAAGAAASVRLVGRRLSAPVDPLALFAALPGAAERMLWEDKNGRTLLMAQAALRAECRGDTVILQALSANGESLLGSAADVTAARLVSRDRRTLTLRFPASSSLDPQERLLAPSPLHALRALLRLEAPDEEPFALAALGVIAFDYAGVSEELPDNPEDPLGFPDYVFWVPETLLLFDPGAAPRVLCPAFGDPDPVRALRNHGDAVGRLEAVLELCGRDLPRLAGGPAGRSSATEVDLDDEGFMAVVRRLKEEIAAGEVYQIVPSRTFRAPCPDPLRAFAALREIEPNSYRFFVRADAFTLFGASPETSVRVSPDRLGGLELEVRPIAGTRPRGACADEDDRIEAEMRLDEKELAEHMMLVDLARNDVARLSVPGTRRVARLLTVERYARVMHLVSSVTGTLAQPFDALDALAACLNVGTLTGAPKLRATELLRTAERTRRGPYGGAVGWLNGAGEADTAVVIRSAVVREGIAYVRAGAGVVHDSDPRAEAEETRRKASALLSILDAGARR